MPEEDDAATHPVLQGEPGEVVIRGANVMRGYLDRPEETAETIVDGWLAAHGRRRRVRRRRLPADRRPHQGHGHPGRREHLPEEIETALYGHEGVLEAAVVGRPDEVLGEVVVAYVSLRSGADVTAGEFHELCGERLAKYKRPATIELLEALPKNPVGKIDKPSLRRLAAR